MLVKNLFLLSYTLYAISSTKCGYNSVLNRRFIYISPVKFDFCVRVCHTKGLKKRSKFWKSCMVKWTIHADCSQPIILIQIPVQSTVKASRL